MVIILLSKYYATVARLFGTITVASIRENLGFKTHRSLRIGSAVLQYNGLKVEVSLDCKMTTVTSKKVSRPPNVVNVSELVLFVKIHYDILF